MSDMVPIVLAVFTQEDLQAFEHFVSDKDLPFTLTAMTSLTNAVEALQTGEADVLVVDGDHIEPEAFKTLQGKCGRPWIILASDYNIVEQALKNGAQEYILKDENWAHFRLLPFLIERVLRVAQDASERKRAERAYRDSKKRIRRLLERQAAINQFSLHLGRTLDISTICQTACSQVQKLVNCSAFALLLYHEKQQQVIPLYLSRNGDSVDTSHLTPIPLDSAGSAVSRAITTLRPVLITDPAQQPDPGDLLSLDSQQSKRPPRATLSLPMVVGKKTVGVMQIQSRTAAAFDKADTELLRGMATLLGMTLHNAELYQAAQQELEKRKGVEQALQRSVHQLRSLNVASQSLTESLDVNEVLHRICQQARDILDAYGCTVYLLEQDGQTLTPVVAIEPGVEEQVLATPVPVHGSLTGRAVRERRSLIFNEVLSEKNAFYIPNTPVYGNERILVAPLLVEDKVIGVLNLDRLGEAFVQEELALAEAFAIYAAAALRNAQAHSRLQHEIEERNRAEQKLRASEERYRSIFELSPFSIWICDEEGTITFANQAAADLYGLSDPTEFVGRYNIFQTLPEIISPYLEIFQQARKQVVAPFEHSLELGLLPLPSKRKETVYVRVTLFSVPAGIERKPNLVVIQEDITERERAQQELQVLNRLYAVLSKSGQAIVRIKDPQALLWAICRLVVEQGGFRMAWIGQLNRSTQQVALRAYAGKVGEYLDKLTVVLDKEVHTQGVIGRAILSGQKYVCNDIEHDPGMEPWREDALRLGHRALVSLPLSVSGEVWGSITLYAGAPGFFDSIELSLLDELASNLSFALEAAEQQAARERAERALKKGIRRQRTLIEAAHQLIESLDISQVLQRISQLAKDILDAYGCTVYLLEEDGQTLTPVAAVEPDISQEQLMTISLPVDASLTGRAVKARRSFIFNDLSREPDAFFIEGTPTYEDERVLVAPLRFKDVVLGAMNVNRIGAAFDERDLALAETFAVYAATAWQNAKTYSELRREIEQRRQAEEALRTSLREKEVLLQELYHRTKNNMQVINAMLALEESRLPDDEAKEVFREVQNRIQVMALVHQKLYQSQDLSRIDLAEYVEELGQLLMRSYNISSERVLLKLHIQDTYVLMDIAIPCGLILNELISNSLKYAFPNDATGVVEVWLTKSEQGDIELVVSDNGVGVPPGFDFRESDTLGLHTVFAIVEHQLLGKVKFETEKGLTCRICFNDHLYSKRV